MGWFSINAQKTEVSGDEPADIIGKAIENITIVYVENYGRRPTLNELQYVFTFVTRPLALEKTR